MFEATRWSPEGWCNATQSRRLILLTTVGSPQTGVHQHNKRRQWIEPHPYEQLHSKKTRETTNKENYKVTTILLPTKDANIPRAPHWRVKKNDDDDETKETGYQKREDEVGYGTWQIQSLQQQTDECYESEKVYHTRQFNSIDMGPTNVTCGHFLRTRAPVQGCPTYIPLFSPLFSF